jgi:hypothetical protein
VPGMKNKVCVRLKNGECAMMDMPKNGEDLITIDFAVGLGGRNLPADVTAIQKALNDVPADQGGPVELLAEDGIVGPKTLFAISRFQKHQFGWADSRVDTDKITITTLRNYHPSKPPAKPKQVSLTQMAKVYLTQPIALTLVRNAIKYIESSEGLLNNTAADKDQAGDRFATLNVFFHLDKLPLAGQKTALAGMKDVFRKMQKAVGFMGIKGAVHGIFSRDPQDQPNLYAFTYFGGYTRRAPDGSTKMSGDDNYAGPSLPEDAIYICTGLEGKAGDFTAYNTVHELAHWVGPELGQPNIITDHSYRHKPDFYNLPPQTALTCADSYAMFAVAASGRGLVEDATIFMPPQIIHGNKPKKP